MSTDVQQQAPLRYGMRQDVFSLPEGTVTIQWPDSLSAESFEELSDWLNILKRKINRFVCKDDVQP